MKYRFMEIHRSAFPVEKMCRALEVARSGYYRWQKAGLSPREEEAIRLTAVILLIHEQSRQVYGSPRIHEELKDRGFTCGRNRVVRLMKAAGVRSRIRRKYRPTTNSNHDLPISPDRLGQNFSAQSPCRIWVGDITYLWTTEGWLYLAVVIDLFSRKVTGWALSERIDTQLTLDALSMALGNRSGIDTLIFHSDRGVQYAAESYRQKLAGENILQSMSRKGCCYDNAVAESFFHSLKVESIYPEVPKTRGQMRSIVFDYIEIFYNRQRKHSFLGYQTPLNFEKKFRVA